MRIDRLHLLAFGPFTNHVINLSSGKEGFHVIYGPNEAGKSSALRAITQMLYGIPARSTDDFVHQKTQMRIGATVRNGSETLDFVRRKGIKSTLRDSQDQKSIDESELEAFLDGLDEDTFRTVFGLHHEQLVEGGRMILEGQGNIGQALFAASAGLSGLRRVMTSLQDEIGGLFKPAAAKPRINAAISNFKEKKRRIKELQLRPEKWSEVDQALTDAQDKRKETESAIKQLCSGRNRLKRVADAVPLIGRREATLVELESVADAVLLPEDFPERRRALLQEQHGVSTDRDLALKRLDSIHAAMEALCVNESLLAQEALVDEIYLRSATNRKALEDSRQKLEPQCQVLEEQVHKALAAFRPDLSLNQIETLRISPPRRDNILELGQQKDRLESQQKHTYEQLAGLEIKKEQAETRLSQMETVSDPAELERSIRRIQKQGDLEERLNAGQEEYDIAERDISSALSRLKLWDGTPSELENLPVPSHETIEHFKDVLDEQVNKLEGLDARRNELEEQQRSTQANIEALRRERDVPTEDMLLTSRDVRNSCWRLVRRSWEENIRPGDVDSSATRGLLSGVEMPNEIADNLADAHEFATERVDDLSDRLRREADRVARLAQLEVTISDIEQALADVRAERANAEEGLSATTEAWNTLWHPLGITPRSPREMTSWAQNQRALVTQITSLQAQKVKLDSLGKTIRKSKDELSSVLRTLGESESDDKETLVALLDRASDIVAARRKAIQDREQLEDQLKSVNTEELPSARYAVEGAANALEEWESSWAKAMDELGEPRDTSPKKANSVIHQIDEMLAAFDKARDLRRRIDQIAQDDQEYRRRVEELVEIVAPELQSVQPDQGVLSLYKDLQQSRNDSVRMDDLEAQRDEEEERCRKADVSLARIAEDVLGLCKEAQVTQVDDLTTAEERSQLRRQHETSLRELDQRLVELASGSSLDDFLGMVKKEDADTLEPEIERLNQEIEEQEGFLKRFSEEIGERRRELRLMDGSAEAAQVADEAQGVLASMTEDVAQYTRLRVAEFALARAIEQYREKNQGPLLRRAGEFFSKLTLGSFTDLSSDFSDNGEDILVGLRAKTTVPIPGMSDGTADQLYLALRLASLEQYLDKHQSIPLILDDILINFDNERASIALEILAGLSMRTQIIFFTHHEHLVELAGENVPADILFRHSLGS